MITRLRALLACGAAVIGLSVAFIPSASAADASAGVHKASATIVASAQSTAAVAPAAAGDSHGCNGKEVSNNTYVHVCYVRYGDVIWVHDDQPNGRTAVGEILFYDSAGFDGAGWYYGYCFDRYSSTGPWDHCSFSQADEHTTVYYRGYDTKGSSTSHFTKWQSEPST